MNRFSSRGAMNVVSSVKISTPQVLSTSFWTVWHRGRFQVLSTSFWTVWHRGRVEGSRCCRRPPGPCGTEDGSKVPGVVDVFLDRVAQRTGRRFQVLSTSFWTVWHRGRIEDSRCCRHPSGPCGTEDGSKVPGVVDDHNENEHGIGQFCQKKHSYNDYEHHRRHVPLRKSPTFRFPVLRQQLSAASLSLTHGADQHRVHDDQDEARDDVDEDGAEPVVDVEVQVHAVRDERRVLPDAPDHSDVRSAEPRRHDNAVEELVEKHRYLGQDCDDVDGDNAANNVFDRAQLLGQHRVTDANVSTTICNISI